MARKRERAVAAAAAVVKCATVARTFTCGSSWRSCCRAPAFTGPVYAGSTAARVCSRSRTLCAWPGSGANGRIGRPWTTTSWAAASDSTTKKGSWRRRNVARGWSISSAILTACKVSRPGPVKPFALANLRQCVISTLFKIVSSSYLSPVERATSGRTVDPGSRSIARFRQIRLFILRERVGVTSSCRFSFIRVRIADKFIVFVNVVDRRRFVERARRVNTEFGRFQAQGRPGWSPWGVRSRRGVTTKGFRLFPRAIFFSLRLVATTSDAISRVCLSYCVHVPLRCGWFLQGKNEKEKIKKKRERKWRRSEEAENQYGGRR